MTGFKVQTGHYLNLSVFLSNPDLSFLNIKMKKADEKSLSYFSAPESHDSLDAGT